MADSNDHAGYAGRDREETISKAVDKAVMGDGARHMPRGRTGVSSVKSPRPGVRDPGKPHKGSEGEPAYGAPMETPAPQPAKPRNVKPDPLKPKEKDDDDGDED